PADRGAKDRRWKVPDGEALGIELLLEPEAERAGLDLEQGDLGIQPPDAIEALEIEDDEPLVGQDAAADAGARAERRDRDALRAAEADDIGYLLSGARPDDEAGSMIGDPTLGDGEVVTRPEITGVRDAIRRRIAPRESGEGLAERRREIHTKRLR